MAKKSDVFAARGELHDTSAGKTEVARLRAMADARAAADEIELLITGDFALIEPIWKRLQTTCPLTVYQNYYWQKAWFETLGVAEGGHAVLVVGVVGERAVFLLPLTRLRRSGITILTSMGGDHANYRFALFCREAGAVNARLAKALPALLAKALPYPVDVLDLPMQPLSWDGLENPLATHLASSRSAVDGSSVSLVADFNAVLERGNAKRKRRILRAQQRGLDELGGYRVVRTATPLEDRQLYQTFLAHKRPWFAERGIADKFADSATEAFFGRLADDNALLPPGERLIAFDYIEADGQVLSLLAGGTCNGQHFGYFTSIIHDGKYTHLSPGSLAFYKRIEAACAEGLRRFDFGVGAERYKVSWCDENHPMVDVLVPLTLKGRLYAGVRRLKTNLKRSIKENPTLWRIVKLLRQRLAGTP